MGFEYGPPSATIYDLVRSRADHWAIDLNSRLDSLSHCGTARVDARPIYGSRLGSFVGDWHPPSSQRRGPDEKSESNPKSSSPPDLPCLNFCFFVFVRKDIHFGGLFN